MPTITDRTRKRFVPETTPQPVPCISTPTGPKSSCVSAADRSDSRPTAQTGPCCLDPVEPAFTHPTHHRLVFLALAAILTLRGHTIANLLRCLGSLAPGHPAVLAWLSPRPLVLLDVGTLFCPRRSSPGLYPRPHRTGWRRHRRGRTPARTFTARVAIATRSVPLTPSPPTAGGTSGSP